MKNLKKLLVALLSLLIALSMFGLYACKKAPAPTQTTFLDITEQEITIVETFEKKVEVSCSDASAILWQSSDESVATVSGGVITGIRQGTTTITAKYGEIVDEVDVVIKPFEYKSFSVTANEYFVMMNKGSTTKISSQIKYDDKVLDGTITFESSDTDVASVSNDGLVTAKAFGNSAITIKGQYKGKTTSVIVNVSVESSVVVSTDKTSYDLNIGDDSEVALSITCYDKGVLVENPEFTYDLGENTDVVTVTSNGMLVAKNSGNTIITCTYENADGEFASVQIAVRVHAKDVVLSNEKINVSLSSTNSDFDYLPYFENIDDEILNASLVTAGGELSLELNETSVEIGRRVGDCTLVLRSRNYNYLLNVKLIYNLEISQSNVADLLTLTKENVELIEDIDIKQYLLENELDKWNSQVEFNGVFDGKGHTVKNLICGQYGLFKNFGGTIKDVTIISEAGKNGVLGSTCTGDAKVENTIIKVGAIEKENFNGALFNVVSEAANLSLEKVIISLPNGLDEKIGFIAGQTSANVNVVNCYFIQGNGKAFGEVVGESGVVGTAKTFADVSLAYYALNDDASLEELKGAFEDAFVVKISNENKQMLKSITSEYVILTEDIAFESSSPSDEFITGTSFTGILDGQGYSIKTILIYNNGLFKTFGGTIKNLTLQACMRGGNMGAVASELCGNAYLENVYIDLPHSVGGQSRQGGVVCNVGANYILTMKNCFITGELVDDAENRGYIARSIEGKVVLENVYASGFSGCFVPEGLGKISTDSKNYEIYESLEKVCIDIAENRIEIGEYVEGILNKNNPIKFIYQSNIADLISATSGNYYLMEDIDLAGISWDAIGFSGVLDGNGYAIKNLSSTMFKCVKSSVTIKNIAFLNVTTPHILYTDLYGSSLTVENVYIQTVAELADFSGVLREVRAGAVVAFKNVFVNSEVTNNVADSFASGVYAGRAYNCALTFENCYAVADASKFASTVIYHFRSNDGVAPTINGTEDVDYFICDSIATVLDEAKTNANMNLTSSMLAKYVK